MTPPPHSSRPSLAPGALSAAGWSLLAAFSGLDGFALSATFAMLVAFPLSLRLDEDVPRWLHWVTTPAGLCAAGAFLLPPGPLAASVAALWLAATVPHLAYGFVRFLSNAQPRAPHAWAEAAGAVGPIVASLALVSSRFDGTFAGFPEPLATLTVTHFHFAFGLLPLALSALGRRRFAATAPLWALVLVPPVVGGLMATRTEVLRPNLLEAVATGILAGSALTWAVASWRPLGGLPTPARWIGRAASLLFVAALGLTPIFATTFALGNPRFTFAGMLRDHGTSLAIAMVAFGALAARYAPFRGVSETLPAPHPTAAPRDVEETRALFRDCRTADLGPSTGGRFDRLARALLEYRFYPDGVMSSTSAFKLEGREAAAGDRIGMVLFVGLFPGLPAVRFPATTIVNVAERGPVQATFGYLTSEAHYGKGAWSARLDDRDGRVVLTLRSRMTPTHPLAVLGLPVYRWFQKRAHAAGIARLAALE